LKIATRDFSKTAGLTPIFDVRIVIYDQKHVYNEFINTFKADYKPVRHVPCFSPSSRAAGSDGATRRHHPSQGHG
jgi:hypothetical protein